ncbi:FAD/NAD(P)-binding domain-containing protein [Ramaria rubella]|nr:FAD/NAD(P)-binding domain-containing protein [Ramaria rubella]
MEPDPATVGKEHISKDQARQIANDWLVAFNEACLKLSEDPTSDVTAVLALFLPNAFWRDKLCLSWNFHTAEGAEKIRTLLSRGSALQKAGFKSCAIDTQSALGGPEHKPFPNQVGAVVEFSFRFELTSPPAFGRALARLVKDANNDWKAYTLYTALESFKDRPFDDRPLGHYNGHTRTWDDVHAEDVENAEKQPTVLIVGAGSSGIITAAHLRRLGVNTLVVERNSRVGDSWRSRYDLLTLHVPVNILYVDPYQKYPENMPIWIPKTKFADFMEYYTLFQEIPIWTNAELLPVPKYDEREGTWSVTILRDGRHITLHPKHLILATGVADEPVIPDFKGMDAFRGIVLHTKYYKNANDWKGKKVVVIGAGVSGSDVALEAQACGAQVTIIQRSPTCILRLSTVKLGMDAVWPPGRPVEDSDFLQSSLPAALFKHLLVNVIYPMQSAIEKDVHDKLREKGYLVGWGEELGQGPIGHLGLVYTKLGGFSLDIGCAQKIIDGDIAVKSKVEVVAFDSEGVCLSDGTKLDADVVALATGYNLIKTTAVKLLGEEVVSTDIWGFDEEGEIKGVFRDFGHPGLWIAAGGFSDARVLSKYLALRIFAQEAGFLTTTTVSR